MVDYHADMDDRSRLLAIGSSIAAGWLLGSDLPVFRIGCETCEFVVNLALTPTQIKRYGSIAENRLENNAWLSFEAAAEQRHCPHLLHYRKICVD